MFRVLLNVWLNLQIKHSNLEVSDKRRHTVWIGNNGDIEGLKRLGILILKFEGMSIKLLLPLGWSTQSVTTYLDIPTHQTFIIDEKGNRKVVLGATSNENYEFNNFFIVCPQK
jgi:hypothetical protein